MSQWSSLPWLESPGREYATGAQGSQSPQERGGSEPLNPVSSTPPSLVPAHQQLTPAGRRIVASVCVFTTPMIIPPRVLDAPRGGTRYAALRGEARSVRADDGSADVRSRYNHPGQAHTPPSQCRSPRTCHRPPLQGWDGYHAHRWPTPAGQTLLCCSVVPTRAWSYFYSDTKDLSVSRSVCDFPVHSTTFRIAAIV